MFLIASLLLYLQFIYLPSKFYYIAIRSLHLNVRVLGLNINVFACLVYVIQIFPYSTVGVLWTYFKNAHSVLSANRFHFVYLTSYPLYLLTFLDDDIRLSKCDIHSSRYHLVGVDMKDLQTLATKFSQDCRLDPQLPTLFIAECVLVYMAPTDCEALLNYISSTYFLDQPLFRRLEGNATISLYFKKLCLIQFVQAKSCLRVTLAVTDLVYRGHFFVHYSRYI